MDKGLLLVGEPGTGQTFFPHALANELDFDFIPTSVGDWQDRQGGYLGTMLGAMSASFEDAASRKGAVLFIDELDSLGDRSRMRDDHTFYEGNVINRFLELTTNLFEQEGAVLVGATNHPHLIDPAVLRSGRLEEHVYLSLPDDAERADILSFHLGRALSADELRPLTDDLVLATAADLERLARRAKREARRRGESLRLEYVRAALPARIALTEEVVNRIAVHEAGHALAALATGFVDSVSIRVESFMIEGTQVQDGGRVKYRMRDPVLPNEKQLLANIRIKLAGMAAEEVVFATRSTGSGGHPGGDLDQATRLA